MGGVEARRPPPRSWPIGRNKCDEEMTPAALHDYGVLQRTQLLHTILELKRRHDIGTGCLESEFIILTTPVYLTV